jgi:hypothetical protein
MPDFWSGVLVSFSGILVGALLSHGFTSWREHAKEEKTKRRVAAALAAEIHAMADMSAECASLANLAEANASEFLLNTQMLLARLPPEPAAFKGLVSQLPLLDTPTVSAVAAFYGSLEMAKRLSTQHQTEKTVPEGHLPILANQWRAVVHTALGSLQLVGKYLPPVESEIDRAALAELVTDLAAARDRKWPRLEIDAEAGKMRFGRASIRNRDSKRISRTAAESQ